MRVAVCRVRGCNRKVTGASHVPACRSPCLRPLPPATCHLSLFHPAACRPTLPPIARVVCCWRTACPAARLAPPQSLPCCSLSTPVSTPSARPLSRLTTRLQRQFQACNASVGSVNRRYTCRLCPLQALKAAAYPRAGGPEASGARRDSKSWTTRAHNMVSSTSLNAVPSAQAC